MRTTVKSKDALKISFRDLRRVSYDRLWEILLSLNLTVEALCAAERGQAQALVDGLKIQYGLTALPSASFQPKKIISYISNQLSENKQTVFLGRKGDMITFWIISRDNKAQLRQTKTGGTRGHEDSITVLLNTTLKKIGAAVGVRYENRSLDEPTGDSPSTRGGDGESGQTL